ncbi:MAG TPA: phosphodiester glycosidase family protein [Gaiellaceae bacterium]|nr:phosphodiester glycosidase family protein [Gaiellaceae bacterium]
MPGVTYEQQVRLVSGSGVVLHVVRAPRHGGLHAVRPVLSDGTVLGTRTVPEMQRAESKRATTVAVNGDFSNWVTGRPSGVFQRDGVLSTEPLPQRAALGIAFDGRLLIERLRLRGRWWGVSGVRQKLHYLNRAFEDPGVALFTRTWGGPTPRGKKVVEVVVTGFPKTLPNGDLAGTVALVRRGGGNGVPPGAVILQARGADRALLRREAVPGETLTVRLGLPGLPPDVADLIGGGPELVRDGKPLHSTDEWFTLDHLGSRHPRTAVGQLADGRVLLVVADGRSTRSAGLTIGALARILVDLGAVRAISLDGGGSSIVSFEGRVLNRPSDGVPRREPNALMVFYYGIYAPPVPRKVVSPNGDGAADATVVSAKLVRRSSVDIRLLRPDGSVAWRHRGTAGRGWIKREVGRKGMQEGRWRWVAEAVDLSNGRESRMARAFTVNKTIGHLRLSKERMRVKKRRGGRLSASVAVTRPARLVVTVGKSSGRRVLFRGDAKPGVRSWRWDGRNRHGAVVPSGRYTVRVEARNGLGAVALSKPVRVVRVPTR